MTFANNRRNFKSLRAALLGSVALSALVAAAPPLAMAADLGGDPGDLVEVFPHGACQRDGTAVTCDQGVNDDHGIPFSQGGLVFDEGFGNDSSGFFPSPATEVVDVSNIDGVTSITGTGIFVRQSGNITVNVDGRNELLTELSKAAGADGDLTIAELTAFVKTGDEPMSDEFLAQFLAVVQTASGIDTSDGTAVVAVNDVATAAIAWSAGLVASFAADASGNITIDNVTQLLPRGLSQAAVDSFIAALPVTDGVVPADVAAAALQAFILDGNIGNALRNSTISVSGGFGAAPDAIGISVESAGGAVNVNNTAHLYPQFGDIVIGIRAVSENGFGAAGPVQGGAITVVNGGDILSQGSSRAGGGIAARSGNVDIFNGPVGPGGDVRIENTGEIDVSTGDGEAVGLRGQSSTGQVTIINSGDIDIENQGDWAVGIAAYSGQHARPDDPYTGNVPGSDVRIENTGNIEVLGDSGAQGIRAISNGGNIDVINSGNITINGRYNGIGISATGFAAGAVAIDNSGNITSTYSSIAAWMGGVGDVTISNAGDIHVTGDDTVDYVINTGDGISGKNNGAGTVSITNSGAIIIDGSGGDGIKAESDGLGNIVIANNGAVTNNTNGGHGIFGTTGMDEDDVAAGAGNVTIANSGAVQVNGNNGIGIWGSTAPDQAGTGLVDITTAGNVSATGANSIGILATGGSASNSAVTIVNGATVSGGSGARQYGIRTEFTATPVDYNNDGFDDYTQFDSNVLFTGSAGVLFLGGTDNVLNNAGTISSLNGMAISAFDGEVTIEDYDWDNIDWAAREPHEEHTRIEETITFLAANETVNNTGTITGDIALGNGDNTLNNAAGGEVTGDFSAGSGNDAVVNRGQFTGNIALGNGNNSFINTGTVEGDVSADAGDDTYRNEGEHTGNVALRFGNNSFTNTGTVDGDVTAGPGENSYQNDGIHTGNVTLGSQIGPVSRTPLLDGDDTYTNTGSHTGDVNLGQGDNVAVNSGTQTGTLTAGFGDDRVTNSGTQTGDANLGGGGNFFTNLLGGLFNGNLTTGSGNDTVDNAGVINGDVSTGAGDDSVANSGVMIGNVDMGSGTNSFDNTAGGVFNSGATVNLGAGSAMTNAGTLSPGGIDVVQATTITGNYTQSPTGSLVIDIDDQNDGPAADSLVVSGSTDLAGTIAPNVINLAKIENEFEIITATDGVTNSGLGLSDANLAVIDTAGFDFELAFGDNNVTLSYVASSVAEIISDAGAGTSGSTGAANIQAAAVVLDEAVAGGGNEQMNQLVLALKNLPDSAAAAQALERLVPSSQGAQASGAATSSASFSNAMLSCQVHSGDYAFTKEGQCYWAKVSARKLDRDASNTFTGVSETGYEFTGGVQVALWDELRLGVALGYEDTSSSSSSTVQALGTSEGQSVRGGIVLKNQWGPINTYFNLAGSYGWYDHKRFVNLGAAGIAQGEQNVGAALSRLRVSYLMDNDRFYVKPMVDLSATYVHLGGYTETGALGANLTLSSASQWILSVTPSVEFGGEFELENETLIRPYLRAGVSFFNTDRMSIEASFAGAPAGIQPFKVTSNLEDTFAEVEAGVHILTPNGLNIRLTYDGRFSNSTRQHAGSVKIGKNF